jgi:curli biogenesis system outer membrane secretion channel CsgG
MKLKFTSAFLVSICLLAISLDCRADGQETSPPTNAVKSGESTTSPADRIEALAAALANGLSAKLPAEQKKMRIGVVPFDDATSQAADFNRALCELLTTELFGLGRYEVIEKSQWDKVLKELKVQEDLGVNGGAMDPKKIKEIGHLAGVEALVTGSITDLQSDIGVQCRLIDIETATILGVAKGKLSKQHIKKLLRLALGDEIHGRVILVVPFENLTQVRCMIQSESIGQQPDRVGRQLQVDRYSEVPRTILEDILVARGASVVERKLADSALLSGDSGSPRPLKDVEQAAKIGVQLAANTVVLGTIVSLNSEQKNLNEYGMTSRHVLVTASMRLRVIDVSSGRVVSSKSFDARETYLSSGFGGLSKSDVADRIITTVLKKVREDDSFVKTLVGAESTGDESSN